MTAHDPPADRTAPAGPPLEGVALPHGLELPILGLPVRFRSNSRRVIEVAEKAFGFWGSRELPRGRPPEREVEITLVVERDGADLPPDPANLRYRYVDRERLLLHAPGTVAIADASRREVVASLSPILVGAGDRFRDGVVEALTLAVLSPLDRTPLHAAAVVREGRALLLAGPSGAGKSTLSYAAVRRGWGLLAEDRVNLQMQGGLRVWGLSRFVRLPPGARAHFPELEGVEPSVVSGGREKLTVDLSDAPWVGALPDRPYADRASLVVLERRAAGAPELRPLDPHALASALPWGSEPGFDVFREEIEEGVRRLARPGGWRLIAGGHPEDSVPLLERIVEGMVRTEPEAE